MSHEVGKAQVLSECPCGYEGASHGKEMPEEY